MATPTAGLGFIGLTVASENLVLDRESRGSTRAVFNRDTKKAVGASNLKDFVAGSRRARRAASCQGPAGRG